MNSDFDLLDKEINQVKKVNSEFKTNKNLIKKRLNKEKYMNQTPHVNTDQISNKIQEQNISNNKNRRKEDIIKNETQIIPEAYKSFFDDSAFEEAKTKGNNTYNTTTNTYSKEAKINEKRAESNQKESVADLSDNATFTSTTRSKTKIKVEEASDNVDLNEFERKMLNNQRKADSYSSNDRKLKDSSYVSRGKDGGKPYRGFGGAAAENSYNANKPKSKFENVENDRNYKAGYNENKRAYDKLALFFICFVFIYIFCLFFT